MSDNKVTINGLIGVARDWRCPLICRQRERDDCWQSIRSNNIVFWLPVSICTSRYTCLSDVYRRICVSSLSSLSPCFAVLLVSGWFVAPSMNASALFTLCVFLCVRLPARLAAWLSCLLPAWLFMHDSWVSYCLFCSKFCLLLNAACVTSGWSNRLIRYL